MSPFERKRLSVGLLQKDLAKKLGVHVSTVAKWENGNGLPAAQYYPALAEVFGMSAEEVTHLFDQPAAATSE